MREKYWLYRDVLVNRLAELYRTEFIAVAMVCDFALDKSGALLGDVRKRHSELKSQQKLSHNTQSTKG